MLYTELNAGVDIHSANQKTLGLPNRLISKVFIFRSIYGGSQYGFVSDPDFTCVSSSLKYWKNVIEKWYDKYQGIYKWHEEIVREVSSTSQLIVPFTGRTFKWDLMKHGSFKIPVPQVKNYPVQSAGADIMSIIRVSFAKRFYAEGIDGVIINTVHDSIVCDVADKDVAKCVRIFNEVFEDAAANISKVFKCNFNLKVRCEIEVGQNQGKMEAV